MNICDWFFLQHRYMTVWLWKCKLRSFIGLVVHERSENEGAGCFSNWSSSDFVADAFSSDKPIAEREPGGNAQPETFLFSFSKILESYFQGTWIVGVVFKVTHPNDNINNMIAILNKLSEKTYTNQEDQLPKIFPTSFKWKFIILFSKFPKNYKNPFFNLCVLLILSISSYYKIWWTVLKF